jgi:mono/diheme cytochrome c family protein
LSRKEQQAAGRRVPVQTGGLAEDRCRSLPAAGCRLQAFFCLLLAACCLLFVVGCRQQMAETGREKPLDASTFFDDQRSARPLVSGTVARGDLRADEAFYSGKAGNALVAQLPLPLTLELLRRGQERFEIFCSPCHGRLGNGEGMVAKRGLRPPPSYHIDRLREVPIGYFFDVVTNGFGIMPDYAAQVPPADRWAIAAYVRALQLSQNAKVAELPTADRQRVEQAK